LIYMHPSVRCPWLLGDRACPGGRATLGSTIADSAGQHVRERWLCPQRSRETEERMITYDVKVHPSSEDLKREDQLAWKIAGVAADKVAVDKDVAEMIGNRIIDNAAVAIAAINRRPVVSARTMALAHPRKNGGAIFGVESEQTFSP